MSHSEPYYYEKDLDGLGTYRFKPRVNVRAMAEIFANPVESKKNSLFVIEERASTMALRRSPKVTEKHTNLVSRRDIYPIYKERKGLVIFFCYTENRRGWEADWKAVEDTFIAGDLDCEVRFYKDVKAAKVTGAILPKLSDEFNGEEKPYNFLLLIVAGHGGTDWVNNCSYINDNEPINGRIYYEQLEAFIAENDKLRMFIGLPKVLLINGCRGKHFPKMVYPKVSWYSAPPLKRPSV